jgi:hypothetical protein
MKRITISNLTGANELNRNEMRATVGGLKIRKCFRIPFTSRKICFGVEIGVNKR